MEEKKYTEERVLWVKRHSEKLLTFALTRPESFRFAAGQFARLGAAEGAGFVWRAYSVVSAEYADDLVFFAVLIPAGPMSAHLEKLQAGDTLLLDKTATGFLLPERFADGEELVMLCTGSGIAPFLSQLQSPELYARFARIALVHCTSFADEWIFGADIAALAEHPLVGAHFAQLHYRTSATREKVSGSLNGRFSALLHSGALQSSLPDFVFSKAATRWMICGNPAMVQDTFKTLLDMGYSMHRNRIPGEILMENGF